MSKIGKIRLEKQSIIDRYESGQSTVEISKDYNCDPKLIHKALLEFGITPRTNIKYKNPAKERLYSLIEHMANNMNIGRRTISKTLHLSEGFVGDAFKNLKIDVSERFGYVDDSISPLVVKLYNQGFTMTDIADKYGYSIDVITRFLKENNIEIRSSKKYSFKTNVIDNGVSSKELAWTFGVLLTDGNCMHRGLQILMCDKDVLEKIRNIFEYTGPISEPKMRKNNKKPIYKLSIDSVELAQKMVNIGLTHNKTHTLQFPENIDNALISHFIRGAMDGDGSISKNTCTLTGNLDFLKGVKDEIKKATGLIEEDFHFYCRNPQRNNSIRCMMLTKKSTIKTFLDWIYKDSTEQTRMNRKYDLYKNLWCNN